MYELKALENRTSSVETYLESYTHPEESLPLRNVRIRLDFVRTDSGK